MKRSIYLFYLIIFYSCNPNTPNEDVESISLDSEMLANATKGKMSVMEFDAKFPTAKEMYIYHDSILLVVNHPQENGYLLEAYNMQTHKAKSKYFRIGKGQGEILRGNVHITDNTLILNDYMAGTYCFANIDSMLMDSKYKPLFTQPLGLNTSFCAPFNGEWIIENSYCFSDKNVGVFQKELRLLTPIEYEKVMQKRHKFNTVNVAGNGLVIVHPKDKNVMYASSNQSFIEIFDKDLTMNKRVIGPRHLNIDYYIDYDDKVPEIIFNHAIPYSYINYCADEDWVYLLYRGVMLDANNGNLEDFPTYIIKTDWSGNISECLFVDAYVLTISKSKANDDLLYICSLNKDGLPQLYKLYEGN